MIAIVGTDGKRPVVWGIGETEAGAREDAQRWLKECDSVERAADLEAHPLTRSQAAIVLGGDPSWPVRLTIAEINGLRTAAGQSGDLMCVALCDLALEGEDAARSECAAIIADAEGREAQSLTAPKPTAAQPRCRCSFGCSEARDFGRASQCTCGCPKCEAIADGLTIAGRTALDGKGSR